VKSVLILIVQLHLLPDQANQLHFSSLFSQ